MALIPRGTRIIFKPMLGTEHAHGSAVGMGICLDPRSRIPIAKTLLHELLHIENPEWSENRVLKEERRAWAKMGWRDKAALYKALGRAEIAEADTTMAMEDDDE